MIISATCVGGYVLVNGSKEESIDNTSSSSASSSATESTTSESSSDAATSTSTSAIYNDGTYTASADYSVPHGYQNSIDISVTIANDIITAVSTDNDYSDNESGMYIDAFESDLEGEVVGQLLSEVSFSRIGGASLTTDGFNEALELVQSAATI